ncbi:MAG: POTRA domain-containing protein, partial [Smithella sp.]
MISGVSGWTLPVYNKRYHYPIMNIYQRRLLIQVLIILIFILFFPPIIQAAKQPVIVEFEGITGPLLENAKKAVQLPPGLYEKGKLDEALAGSFVREVPQKVREALQPFGYYQPEIKTSWEKRSDDQYRLLITVDAGSPIKVAMINVNITGQGVTEAPLLELTREFPLKNGDTLRQDMYEKAKEELIKKSVDLGYLQATFSTHIIRISQKELKADIELTLDTGPRFYFGDITFTGKGTTSYPENFLRRYLEFKKGDIFSYEEMAQTQANYAQADRFKEISVNAVKEKAINNRVPIEISLTPSPAKNFRIGAGYGTDTGPRGTLRY